jgi:hypothetical protein
MVACGAAPGTRRSSTRATSASGPETAATWARISARARSGVSVWSAGAPDNRWAVRSAWTFAWSGIRSSHTTGCRPAAGRKTHKEIRNVVVAHLERTRDAFVAATSGLTAAQLGYAPEPGRWSIADIIALVEIRTLDLVVNTLPLTPAPSDGKVTGAARFTRLDGAIPPREQRRLTAPEPRVPKGTWPGPEASMAGFLDARGKAIEAAAAVGDETLAHVVPHRREYGSDE